MNRNVVTCISTTSFTTSGKSEYVLPKPSSSSMHTTLQMPRISTPKWYVNQAANRIVRVDMVRCLISHRVHKILGAVKTITMNFRQSSNETFLKHVSDN